MKKPILILGASGFLGQKITAALLPTHPVRGFDRCLPAANLASNQGIDWIIGDIRDEVLVTNALSGCETLIHLISTTTPESAANAPIADCETNVLSAIRIFDSAGKLGIKRIIYASSGGTIYGIPPDSKPLREDAKSWPITPYGIQKATIEKYLHYFARLYGMKGISLRIANPYGMDKFVANRRQGVIDIFLQKALSGQPVEVWGDGSVARDYLHVDDVVSAFILSLAYSPKSQFEVFNIGSGQEISLNEIIAILRKFVDVHVEYKEGRNFDVPTIRLNCMKALEDLQWKAQIDIAEGIAKTFSKLKEVKSQV